ncbi:unnamed protein product [Orchesella dallaii]|uniref:Odorant receptor n=1 Tax=Orchesella dallaii TaxID=48710 RepID=A0ABP1R819_9HEXA
MLISACNKYLTIHFKLCSYFLSSPVEWNTKTRRYTLLQSTKWQLYNTLVAVHCVHCFLLLGNALHHQTHSVSVRLIKWNNVLIIFSSVFFHLGSWKGRVEIASLLNSLMIFEEKCIRLDTKSRMKPHVIEKAVVFSLAVTPIFFGVSIGMMLLVKPCFPPYLGSMLFDCAWLSSLHSLPAFLRIVFSVFVAWSWLVGSSIAFLQVSILFITTGCLNNYLDRVKRKDLPENIYREVQLLAGILNTLQQYIILPSTQIIATISAIMSLYSLVNLHSAMPLPMVAFCADTVFCAFACTFYTVFGAAAQVFVKSKKLPMKWRQQSKLPRGHVGKTFRAFAKSCAPIKIKCGSLNFISVLTPMRFINFVIVTTVKMTVMGRSRRNT